MRCGAGLVRPRIAAAARVVPRVALGNGGASRDTLRGENSTGTQTQCKFSPWPDKAGHAEWPFDH